MTNHYFDQKSDSMKPPIKEGLIREQVKSSSKKKSITPIFPPSKRKN